MDEGGSVMMWTDEFFDEVHISDTVFYQNNVGQIRRAKAVMKGPAGWVCDTGGGQPVVVNEGNNYVGHKPSKNRKKDHFGDFLFDR